MKLISIIFCLFFSINLYSQTTKIDSLISKYGLEKQILDDWKKDKYGCKKLRSSHARKLENNEKIIGIHIKEFLSLFGTPNKINRDQLYVYKVYANCNRKNNKLKDTNYAELVAAFNNDKLISISLLITE
ncbi:MAG: hypothetical protein KA319_01315 [Ferruginibacter sp.]|nr:hypothetical protein [Ferruginibacter sp.]